MEKDTITVLYKEPYREPREITIPNTLENFQQTVRGYIQVIPAVTFTGTKGGRRLVLICDEEAKLKEPKPLANLFLGEPPLWDIVYGPVVVCAAEEEWFDGLTEDELQIAEAWLRMVEIVKVGDAPARHGTYKIEED